MRGTRVHITGSAGVNADGSLLATSHAFVSALSARLIDRGAGLVIGIGDEPLGKEGLPCIFDWTVLETIATTSNPSVDWPCPGAQWPTACFAHLLTKPTVAGLRPKWNANCESQF